MAMWLMIERLENWQVDEAEGFKRFGLSEAAAKRAAKIDAGDLLFFYVSSGISAFSDIRIATSKSVIKLSMGGDYDTGYPFALQTRPHAILDRKCWLPMREMASKLAFSAGKDWRQLLRTTLRKLDDTDGALLLAEMLARANKII